MRISQLYQRLLKVFKQRFLYKYFGAMLFKPKTAIDFNALTSFSFSRNPKEYNNPFPIENLHKDNVVQKADRIVKKEFSFLNSEYIYLGNPVDWADPSRERLWIYELNYFEFIPDLIEAYYYTGRDRYAQTIRVLIAEWISNNTLDKGVTWEPYPISKRLISWTMFWEMLCTHNKKYTDQTFIRSFLHSIEQQARFLCKNLEMDLLNNHYTANGKALFWIGVCFPDFKYSDRWLRKGLKILHTQLEREISNDGSQYENSTSYQMVTVKDYLEMLILAEKNEIDLHPDFKISTEKMAEWLVKIMKPDGSVPLLNDSVQGYPIEFNELMAATSVYFKRSDFKYASDGANLHYLFRLLGNEGYRAYRNIDSEEPDFLSTGLQNSGYYIMRNGWDKESNYLIFDAGQIGPKHCCGHAHADNLSIELYSDGQNIFVDPGTYEYGNGTKRNYYRSTRAHNTIEIEQQDQSTFWGAFRVGDMAKTKFIKAEFNNDDENVVAEHYGYKRLKQNTIHSREISWNKDGEWDIKDTLTGKGKLHGELNFQLGTEQRGLAIDNNRCWIQFPNVLVEMTFEATINIMISEAKAFVSDEWNNESESKRLQVQFEGELPTEINTHVKTKKLQL